MQLPQISSYGPYSSGNYGVNAMCVRMPGITVYFSYKTPVAFETAKTGLVCRVNDWSTTTGKHLNAIQPDKSKRVSGQEFERLFAEATA